MNLDPIEESLTDILASVRAQLVEAKLQRDRAESLVRHLVDAGALDPTQTYGRPYIEILFSWVEEQLRSPKLNSAAD